MSAMTLQQRYEDIAKRSGFSENVVKRVMSAQADSIIQSLKSGDSATIPQICKINPELRKCIKKDPNGGFIETKYIRVRAKPMYSLQEKLGDIEEYIEDTEENNEDEDIRVAQIGSLM